MKLGGSNLLSISEHRKITAFTIIELLVVIVVIGILAAITVVSYTGITNRASIASAQSDLSNASKKLKIYQLNDDNEDYPIDKATAIASNLIPDDDNLSYYVDNTTNPKTFCLSYINQDNNIAYSINQDGSPIPAPYCPVLYLDASNPNSYPSTGTTWYDLSGNGNNGTLNNSEFISLGDASYLRNINNLSNFFSITVPDSTSLYDTFSVTSGGWTIEETIWTNSTVYPESDAGSVASTRAYGTTPTTTGFDWNHGMSTSNFRAGLTSEGAASTYDDEVTLNIPAPYNSLNIWRTRTIVWDRTNNQVLLYINGDYFGSLSTPNTAGLSVYDGGGVTFGELYGWKHYGRRGVIKVYSRVLNTDEVSDNYGLIEGKYGP